MACLFAGLAAVYLLTYQGVLRSGDEGLLASAAQSLGRLGAFDTGPVFPDRGVKAFAIEPGQAIVGALIDGWAGWAGVGSLQALFLINVYATALTAAAVYGLVRQLGGGPPSALGAALAYGLATMAWPHTQFLFRDPLAVLWSTLGVWSCEAALDRPKWAGQAGLWLVGMALFGLAVFTKQTTTFVAVGVFVAAIARALAARSGQERGAARHVVALTTAMLFATWVVPPVGALGRLSAWYYLDTLRESAGRLAPATMSDAVVGMLASPGKGLFLESPVLLLALAAAPITARREGWPRLVLPWAALALLLAAVPVYRDQLWWGGVGWGVRHTLPVIPLLVAASAPAWQAVSGAARSGWRWAAGVLAAISVLIQFGAAAGSLAGYYAWLSGAAPGAAWTLAIWDPRFSEAVGYWRTLLLGVPASFAWLRLWEVRPAWMIVGLLAGLIGLAVLAVGLGRRLLRAPSRWAAGAALVLALAVSSLAPYSLLRALAADPGYAAWRADFRAAADFVARQARPGDVVLVRGYLHPLWSFVFNYARWPAPWYAISPEMPVAAETAAIQAAHDPGRAVSPETRALVADQFLGRYRRLWLLNDRGAPAGDLGLEEWWLAEQFVPVRSFGDLTRVTQFELVRPAPNDLRPADITFGSGLRLQAWAWLPGRRLSFRPGDVLPVALSWRAKARLNTDFTVGLYLLDEAGAVAVQRDSQPVNGYRPMTGWSPGESVLDLHGLELPDALPPGQYRLALAVYDWRTMERLPAAGPDGPEPARLALLGSVTVAAP